MNAKEELFQLVYFSEFIDILPKETHISSHLKHVVVAPKDAVILRKGFQLLVIFQTIVQTDNGGPAPNIKVV